MSVVKLSFSQQIEHLYGEHRGWLSVFIQRRTGCPDATADLIQDTYLRLLSGGKLPEQQDSRRFLTHIAKGLLIDRYRRKNIEDAYLEYLSLVPEEYYPSPQQQVMMVESLIEIDVLLQKMPSKVRQALLLRQLEGLSYKDIAQQLGVSVSSVEKYIAKALRACLLAVDPET